MRSYLAAWVVMAFSWIVAPSATSQSLTAAVTENPGPSARACPAHLRCARPPVLSPGPSARACPASLLSLATCSEVRDQNGAYVLFAMPKAWNRKLVVHAHGGPRSSPPASGDGDEDLERFAVFVREGYAWVGSTYRKEGYGVRRAAADVELSRVLFLRHFGTPERTILHGQSWGGQVAAKAAELHGRTPDGEMAYSAVLLTNGILAGGARAYAFRAELRAIYQYYCKNHPRPEELQYPLWMGLPAQSTMTESDLRARLEQCTGISKPPNERTAEQNAILQDIAATTGVGEKNLLRHLSWATFVMRTLIGSIGGGNPFETRDRRYEGSQNDRALNRDVVRFGADRQAAVALSFDSEPTGQIIAPTLTLHAIRDPIASYALEREYAEIVARAGRSDLLMQIAVDDDNHGRLPEKALVAGIHALEQWIGGERPTQESVAKLCRAAAGNKECPILPDPIRSSSYKN